MATGATIDRPTIDRLAVRVCHAVRDARGEHQAWIALTYVANRLDDQSADAVDAAIAFARPYELKISTDSTSTTGLAARVNRVLLNGAIARIELVGETVLNGSGRPPELEVEITREELAQLELSVGQRVRLVSQSLRAFPYAAGQ